jgi:RNA polymerase sigma-70 factor (ECF subfamily)
MTLNEARLLEAARGGDGRAFDALVTPHRRSVLGQCYRMLGSVSDAEDAAQECLVRAWRHLATYESRSSLRTWLHTIAARASLDMLERRAARRLPSLDGGEPSDPSVPPSPPSTEVAWLEPCADDLWCDGDPDAGETPESSYTRRESVALAFMAALHLLPASQRAALLMHELGGSTAAEVAAALDTSVASVNSAIQRARRTLDERAASWRSRDAARGPVEAEAVARYVRAWESSDPDALARVLRADATLAMPPVPEWYAGRDAVAGLYRWLTATLGLRFVMVPAPRTNGQAALAQYNADRDDPTLYRADALHVLTVDGAGAVSAVMVFMGPQHVEALGIPVTLRRDPVAGSTA